MSSKAAAAAAGKIGTSKFKWIKPDVYPLIAAMGVGIGFLTYSTLHNFSTNPDVRVQKTLRADGVSEDAAIEKCGAAYKTSSVYRNLAAMKGDRKGIF
eukprot:jgi/Botrbrau1/7332/Bobra.247_3s0027.1